MSQLNHAEKISIARGMVSGYEADAFRAELRAIASEAAGNDDQAKAESDTATAGTKMAAAVEAKLNEAIAAAEKDGYEVKITNDGSVYCRRPVTESSDETE